MEPHNVTSKAKFVVINNMAVLLYSAYNKLTIITNKNYRIFDLIFTTNTTGLLLSHSCIIILLYNYIVKGDSHNLLLKKVIGFGLSLKLKSNFCLDFFFKNAAFIHIMNEFIKLSSILICVIRIRMILLCFIILFLFTSWNIMPLNLF